MQKRFCIVKSSHAIPWTLGTATKAERGRPAFEQVCARVENGNDERRAAAWKRKRSTEPVSQSQWSKHFVALGYDTWCVVHENWTQQVSQSVRNDFGAWRFPHSAHVLQYKHLIEVWCIFSRIIFGWVCLIVLILPDQQSWHWWNSLTAQSRFSLSKHCGRVPRSRSQNIESNTHTHSFTPWHWFSVHDQSKTTLRI